MKVLLDIKDSKAAFVMELLHSLKFVKAEPFSSETTPATVKPLTLETDTDKAIEKGLKSRMVEEKNFEKEFKKHSAKWRKHYSA